VTDAATLLRRLFSTAVEAVSARNCIGDSLSHLYDRPALIIGAGKAAAAMAAELEARWSAELRGLVIVPYNHGVSCRNIDVLEAAHPVPDEAGVEATRRILESVSELGAEDTVICLLSGGGSSLLSLPAAGISLSDKQTINAQLLRSGATIGEINCVRKQISAIKGGKLASACAPAKLITLLISDVPGNDVSVIASGPTVPDTTTSSDAIEILERFSIVTPDSVRTHLTSHATPAEHMIQSEIQVLASTEHALQAAAEVARSLGIEPLNLGDLEGDAAKLAQQHANIAIGIANGNGPVTAPAIILSGGETTVRVRGNGRGGRNGEYALALALALHGHPSISAIACDTDGIDGSGDNAGCIVTPDSLSRAAALSIDAVAMQSNNDSYQYFSALDDLVVTGPTLTNVNDFRAILIDTTD
jgi:hydroxypyruvate reductase